MMLPRFWVPSPLLSGTCELPDFEAHHLRNVLRMAVGESIELFDGAGRSAVGIISNVSKRSAQVQVAEVKITAPERPAITLATAIPKGDRFDWLIEKATEIGVSTLVPLRTSRSTVDPRDSKIERLRQVVIAACKQSRRNDALVIEPVTDWSTFLAKINLPERWILAHPGGASLSSAMTLCGDAVSATPILAAVGPEGGWSDEEAAEARDRGAISVSLGPHILRVETAGLYLAATLKQALTGTHCGGGERAGTSMS
ncbi:MAG: RsmE family RNA methyltransferase [Planctomycetaceae bacterium]|nr:RsmE family RNA methyltransferase [Planctomycetaceae bacterium]